ncbi:hypothetical protein HJC23_002397 [Cyclotella cryptica]|uniref:Uncharacterized protein n=1 Tax=Cyclotella cryptica TaxID=29204 RepID=A0ABD3QM87_9STRA|eukprot:CCRYP_004501-RA/>CCRYP_004501-RA protein AED:0.11 eAED:0.11 QI:0/-1/0/1/-1/1/1/0/456
MSSAGRKRPFGATIRTLSDITNSPPGGDAGHQGNKSSVLATTSGVASNSVSNGAIPTNSKINVQHIPTLPQANEASSILARIHSEFATIIQRRNWNVRSITEMCCCGDGIDCLRNRTRKTKVMPNNVLGYNLTTFSRGKSHSIHLRLRHPKTHALMDYQSIAGTMCHELAHCLVGPHNAEFYRVMEEIEQQYAMFLTKGVVLDKSGFPVGSQEAHVLGGGKISPDEARRKACQAAELRRKNGLTSGHYVLGGSQKMRDPKEAARIAAERRLRDSQFCLPCNEVIEILGEDSDEGEEGKAEDPSIYDGTHQMGRQRTNIRRNNQLLVAKSDSITANEVIDLTEDDFFYARQKSAVPNVRKLSKQIQWECACCTLVNQPAALSCEACGTPPNMSAVAPASVVSHRSTSSNENTRSLSSKSNPERKACGLDTKKVWSCTRCTFDNPLTLLVCGACCLER